MPQDRMLRINELIRQEVASFLYREINEPGFDLSAVTVTQVITSSNLRNARVLVSIRGTPVQQHAMLNRLRHHRAAVQQHVGKQVVIKYTPHIAFELDESIARGDHVLHMISRLETEHPEWDDGRPKPTEPKPTEPEKT